MEDLGAVGRRVEFLYRLAKIMAIYIYSRTRNKKREYETFSVK